MGVRFRIAYAARDTGVDLARRIAAAAMAAAAARQASGFAAQGYFSHGWVFGHGWRLTGFYQTQSRRTASSSKRTAPLTSSATPTDKDTEISACLRPMVFNITAKVEMHGM